MINIVLCESAACIDLACFHQWTCDKYFLFPMFIHNDNNNNMYIYHALINALRAHMIYVNLNMIFYTHVEHSPTKTIYVRHYTHTHTHTHTHIRERARDCSRNWVLILIGVEILWEEEGFQYGFKRWQSLAVSKVFWEWIPIPQQQTVQKPWVLRLCCWIFSVQVSSEGLWRSSVFLVI